MAKIKAINISNIEGKNTFYINQAILYRNKGIINDRYYENFNKKIKNKLEYKDFRRNIITSGIDLNNTINKKIQIGNIVLKIHQLCQPCKYLQSKLGVKDLIKLLVHKSGVRAEIITSGVISTNDQIKIIK